MQGLARIELAGTLTKDAELKYTPGGLAITELNVAGDSHVIDQNGDVRALPWYHNASLFGAFAEAIVGDLLEGMAVYIVGRLNYRSWESQDGQKRSAVDVAVDTLKTLGVPDEDRVTRDSRGQARLQDAVNRVLLMGNLTRDAELRYTTGGQAVTRAGIAVNERFKSRGEDRERVGFYTINAWREPAEVLGELGKGIPVIATGRLVNDSWTDREGNKRYETRVEADRVEVVATGEAARPAPAAPVDTSHLNIDEEFPPEEDLPF